MKKQNRILVVDDDEVILSMMKQLLEASGFQCDVTPEGRKALQMVSESPPDLIILDVSMPEMSGFELCEILRREEISCEIPIIFLSAQTELDDRMKGFEKGADDYVPKPFSFDELNARIKVALKKVERLEKERKRAETLENEARKDAETGVFHRKYFESVLPQELQKSKYSNMPLAVLAVDIDKLGNINEEYGFKQGNRVILQVANTLSEFFENRGIVSRFEGGEFAVILPGIDIRRGEDLSEEVRKRIEDRAIESYPSGYIHATVSIGVTEWDGREKPDRLFKKAESAMYRGKKTGKNKVTCG